MQNARVQCCTMLVLVSKMMTYFGYRCLASFVILQDGIAKRKGVDSKVQIMMVAVLVEVCNLMSSCNKCKVSEMLTS